MVFFLFQMTVTCCDVTNCDTRVWYTVLKKYTNQQIHIPIPDNIVEYLKCDGTVILPDYKDLQFKRKLPSDDSWASSDDDEVNNRAAGQGVTPNGVTQGR